MITLLGLNSCNWELLPRTLVNKVLKFVGFFVNVKKRFLLLCFFTLFDLQAGWRDWFAWPQMSSWRVANSHSLYERLRTVKPSTRNKALITGGVVVVGALAITGWRYWKNRRSGSSSSAIQPDLQEELNVNDYVRLLSTNVEYQQPFVGKLGLVVNKALDGYVLRMLAEEGDDKEPDRYIFLDKDSNKDSFERVRSKERFERPDLTDDEGLEAFEVAIDFLPRITTVLDRKMFIGRVLAYFSSGLQLRYGSVSEANKKRLLNLQKRYKRILEQEGLGVGVYIELHHTESLYKRRFASRTGLIVEMLDNGCVVKVLIESDQNKKLYGYYFLDFSNDEFEKRNLSEEVQFGKEKQNNEEILDDFEDALVVDQKRKGKKFLDSVLAYFINQKLTPASDDFSADEKKRYDSLMAQYNQLHAKIYPPHLLNKVNE